MQIDIEVRTTFFDEVNSGFCFEFTTPKPKHLKDLNTEPIISDNLICEVPMRNVTQRGVFSLHNQTLAFYRGGNTEIPYIILELEFSILEIRNPDDVNPDYGFRVTRDGLYIDFYAPSKDIIDRWVEKLRNVCILLDFHEDYKVTKKLGKGSFATVYLGESKHDKKSYAIKVFKKRKLDAVPTKTEKLKLAILNEITVMRAMNHDGVVKLYEVYETKTSLCLVIQLIKGKTLQSVLKKSIFQKKLSQSKIYDMMHSILTSLAYVASQGIMHRDLKPGNILIDSNEKLYIGDFGLSTFIKRPKYLFKRCGTPGYMAPEVFCYNEKLSHTFYDDRCDVFSVGCIFYQMLFGSKLFNSKEPDGILKDNKNFDAYSKNVYNIHKEMQNKSSKISKDALKLLLLLLEPEPENRPTAAEALEHPYFDSTNRPLQTPVPTKPDLRSTSSLVLQSPLLKSPGGTTKQKQHFTFNFQEDSSNSGSFVIQGANRIVERESLYLDMSRSDNNLKSENNLTSRSAVDSIGDNDKTPVNSYTQGKTTNRTPPATQRKSLKGTPSNRASFLKAAIINNLNKQGGEMNFRDDSDSDDLNPRRHKTDSNFAAGRSSGSHEDHKLHSADESLAYDEIDSENSDIKINLEHLKNNTPKKFPSRESREAHGLTRINGNITVKN